MLSQMRKHAGSWMIKVLLFAIVVVFSFWGVGSFRNRKDTSLAKVNGEAIGFDLYRQNYNSMLQQYRNIYGNQLDNMLKVLNLRRQALDQLVDRVLMLQEAKRLKISVSDEEVAGSIRDYPAFQANGAFDKQRYFGLLNQIRMSPEEFEAEQLQSLQLQKLQVMVQDSVFVSEDEAREWYDWYNAEVDVDYALFTPQRYQDITPTEKEIADYFDAHQEDYRTDPVVKIRYLFFDPQRYKETVQINDDQVAQYYERHPEEFTTEKTVQARHIILKLDENADDETVAAVKAKAQDIYKLAIGGKDFAALAKEYSEGPTRDRGGELGTFKRDAMVKPFGDKAFAMKAGEISEPVRTQFGWHIIKVEKVNEGGTQPLEETKDRIRDKLLNDASRSQALAQAEKIYDNVLDGDNLDEVGKTFDVPVKITDFFSRQETPIKDIGNSRQFMDVAFGLEKDGISEILDLKNGFYLLQGVDRQEAVIPPLDSVVDKVKTDVIESRRDDMAKTDAEAFLAKVKEGGTFEGAAKSHEVEVKSTGFYKRTGSIPDIGRNPKMTEAIFALSAEKPLCEEPMKGAKGWYVLRLKDRKKPDVEGFEKEKSSIVARLTQQQKQSVFRQWLDDVKSRSTIDINYKLIEN